MTEKKEGFSRSNLFAGVLFVLLAVLPLLRYASHSVPISSISIKVLLSWAGYLVAATMLVIKRKDFIICICFFLIALCDILSIFVPNISIFYFIASALRCISYVFMGIMSLAIYTNCIPKYKDAFNNKYFIPAICIAVSSFIFACITINNIVCNFWGVPIRYLSFPDLVSTFKTAFPTIISIIIEDIIEIFALFLTSMYIVHPDGIPHTQFQIKEYTDIENGEDVVCTLPREAYCSMVKHVLLLLFTFGIWWLVWIYKVTGYLNAVKDEEPRNPTTKLLLCIFVPFYQIYWTYKSAQRIDKLEQQNGASSGSVALCLVMAIVLPIIAPILMQVNMNNILTKKKANVINQKEEVNIGAASELKIYKELLDSGTITQEEFEEKKKQLLNL